MNSDPNSGDGPAIEVRGVGKRFRLRGGMRTLKSAALDTLRGRRAGDQAFWALRNVSFTVARGETLGLIGANGAGKSTLLALLAGTKQATEGTLHTRGAVSSLLELGAGFHPDLTGRENVFLAGAIMGLSRRQMAARFDAIVDFAGIPAFIDQPVKHYSSGMYVRLGFAVAVEVDPDILLVDEVLAVGDSVFQRKCLERIRDFKQRGKTLLIISHDLGTIQSISDRILLLDQGTVAGIGEPGQVLNAYQALTRKAGTAGLEREWGTGEVRLTEVVFLDDRGQPTDTVRWGEGVTVRVGYEASRRIEDPVFGFAVADDKGRLIYGNNTQIERFPIAAIEGRGALTLRLRDLRMASGAYLFSFSVHSADHRTNYHRLDHAFPLSIVADKPFEGVCYVENQWSLT